MSGIAGLVRFDGRTVMRRELERAANTLKQYGPDRVDIVAKENYRPRPFADADDT